MVNPRPQSTRFTMRNAQVFDRLPVWQAVMTGSDEQKLAAFRDPSMRRRLHAEAVEGENIPVTALPIRWEGVFVAKPALDKNAGLAGKSVAQVAQEQDKDVLDAFLDLVVEETLATSFRNSQAGGDNEAMAAMLGSPYTMIGLSDAGAHVVFEAGYGYSSVVLGHWVREERVLTLEEAVRKLSFMQASVYGLHDRGLLRPGMAADVVVFDPRHDSGRRDRRGPRPPRRADAAASACARRGLHDRQRTNADGRRGAHRGLPRARDARERAGARGLD